MADRRYLPGTREALSLLAMQVGIARRERGWTEQLLGERAGVSRGTVRKVEAADPGVGIGLALEVAVAAGVQLFHASDERRGLERARYQDRLALLPDHVPPPPKMNDDF